MNIFDILIVGLLIFGAYMGFRNGFTKQLVQAVGLIIVAILAFQFKGIISELMYKFLPFFNFTGEIRGVQVLNILLYELIAFLLLFTGLMIGLRLLMMATSLFEAFLNATFILGIPSKILGALVGIIQYFVIVFITLYIFSLPIFDNTDIKDSKLSEIVLAETPFLSRWTNDAHEVLSEFATLKDKYGYEENTNQFNLEALDILLKYQIVDIDSVDYLVRKNKLEISQVETVLREYR